MEALLKRSAEIYQLIGLSIPPYQIRLIDRWEELTARETVEAFIAVLQYRLSLK